MARRQRALDRAYKHTLTVKPLTPCYWTDDTVSAEVLAVAAPEPAPAAPKPKRRRKAKPAPELEQVVIQAVQEGLAPEPYEPTPPEPEPPKPQRKPKPIAPPSPWRLVFSPEGEMIGFRHVDTNEFDPLGHKKRNRT